MKNAIIVLSDPKNESEESLGRVFNALATAYDLKNAGKDVSIIFQGTGTRWPEVLQNEDHPAHELFEAVADKVEGISCACADVFGADTSGYDLIKDNAVPKTTGLPSLSRLQDEGSNVYTF
ncbi:MAG: DsrE family protein [Candidatus Nitronauta litoralis]|uniref:DsrE family protein n=1 Tax=Candidatus Nitronauta litoralis TaxID=2705533 RepID=A0A7T0BWT0_9BACT|nr:MAG: DsrE family protein [Candidatus Nitronauta litoralis]